MNEKSKSIIKIIILTLLIIIVPVLTLLLIIYMSNIIVYSDLWILSISFICAFSLLVWIFLLCVTSAEFDKIKIYNEFKKINNNYFF